LNPADDAQVARLSSDDIALLCEAMLNGELSVADGEALNARLKTDPAALSTYLESCEMHAMLLWEHGTLGGKHGLVIPISTAPAPRKAFSRGRLWAASIAALIAFVASFVFMQWSRDQTDPGLAENNESADDIVAIVTGLQNAEWKVDAAYAPGQSLRSRERLDLTRGIAEVTFASGARVTLEGPASFETISAWDGNLRSGILRASVPAEAAGFRVTAPDVEIGQGTDFGMEADSAGATDVFVFSGEAQALGRGEQKIPLNRAVLRAKDARRFSKTGIAAVKDPSQRLARLNRLLAASLERVSGPASVVRWPFDSISTQTTATVNGEVDEALRLQFISRPGGAASACDGHSNGALHLDGKTIGRATVPGLSANTPKTVAVWVRIPTTGAKSEAGGFYAWQMPGGGKVSVRVGLNSRAEQGMLGALRTDFGRGFVVGSTPLQPGKWHHLAVVFIPREKAGEPVHVLQYVDGRLEGLSSPPGKMRKTLAATEEPDSELPNTLWLGRGRGANQELFMGDMDDFVLVNRALAPQEIMRLMQENK